VTDLFCAVPVKDLVNAKQRLAAALTQEERSALAAAMLEDVLDALLAARIGEVRLVTRDAAAIALATRHGVACLTEAVNRGHTEAVALAQREAGAAGARVFVTIPGDVPCVTGDELRDLAAAAGPAPAAVFVPSASGFGTNGVALTPPDAMPLKFGEPSFANHLDAARSRGLAIQTLSLPGLGLDIDAPDDLAALLRSGPETRSRALLVRLGVAARLAGR
jgi:2-phospho-L-lactate guanylyltransferase